MRSRFPGVMAGRVADRHVRDRKGALLAPKRIEFVDALPLTALGKIDKKAIRAGYWAGRERGVR